MSSYEYMTIPAPMRSEKTKGAKTPSDRYAATLTEAINKMAADGWEYLRAETLPSEERSGLTGRTTLFHNLLIFRRPAATVAQRKEPAAPRPVARPEEKPAAPAAHDAGTPLPTAAPSNNPQAEDTASPVFSEKMRVAEKSKAE
ncbi:DUF4177 domain-containing protein [Paracoccus albus]|uniref:DUF4177 domain-containing protein n=1 Tax=Paracoccus albus TaxID=3017784 RepID=UPI0022F03C38|nr:DUF4177 domain-containing protein [Paracoccus albus]WBU61401.1 DUF4177 domain-containing protein [Paracoccus albus]